MYMFMYDNNNKDNILIIIIINKSTEKSEKNFSSHEARVDSSGRADAATAERGDDHRCKDSQPGQECQRTLLKRRASLG